MTEWEESRILVVRIYPRIDMIAGEPGKWKLGKWTIYFRYPHIDMIAGEPGWLPPISWG